MAKPSSRAPLAGGFLLSMSLIAGALVGVVVGEPSMGLVGGFIVGLALLVAVWAIDRRRS